MMDGLVDLGRPNLGGSSRKRFKLLLLVELQANDDDNVHTHLTKFKSPCSNRWPQRRSRRLCFHHELSEVIISLFTTREIAEILESVATFLLSDLSAYSNRLSGALAGRGSFKKHSNLVFPGQEQGSLSISRDASPLTWISLLRGRTSHLRQRPPLCRQCQIRGSRVSRRYMGHRRTFWRSRYVSGHSDDVVQWSLTPLPGQKPPHSWNGAINVHGLRDNMPNKYSSFQTASLSCSSSLFRLRILSRYSRARVCSCHNSPSSRKGVYQSFQRRCDRTSAGGPSEVSADCSWPSITTDR